MRARAGRAPLDTDVALEIPEHIVFRYRVAGPTRRALAQLLDLLLCYGVLAVVVLLAHLAAPSVSVGALGRAGTGVLLLLLFAIQWIYFVAWEGSSGRTPGKMAVGARVVTVSGRPIGWAEAALRNLLRAADLLPTAYLVGAVAMALSRRFQRLGDLVAGTMVVLGEAPRGRAAPIALAPPATNAELAALPPVVTLDADERAAIELFLLRRPSLGVARERELAAMIAPPLAAAIGVRRDPGSELMRDPARFLALVHHRAVNAGRTAAPPSLRPGPRRS